MNQWVEGIVRPIQANPRKTKTQNLWDGVKI